MFPALCLIVSHCLIPVADGIYGVSEPSPTYFLPSASWAPPLLVLSLCLSFSIGDPLSMHCFYASVSLLFVPSLCTLCLSFPTGDHFSMHSSSLGTPSPCTLCASVLPLQTPSQCTVPMPQFPHWGPPLCTLFLCISFPIEDSLHALFLCLSFPTGDPLSMLCPYGSVSSFGTPSPCTVPVPQFPHWQPPFLTVSMPQFLHRGPPLRALSPCLSFPIAPRGASRVMGPCVPPPPSPALLPLSPAAQASPRR